MSVCGGSSLGLVTTNIRQPEASPIANDLMCQQYVTMSYNQSPTTGMRLSAADILL